MSSNADLFQIIDPAALALQEDIKTHLSQQGITLEELIFDFIEAIDSLDTEEEMVHSFSADVLENEQGVAVRWDYIGAVGSHWHNGLGETVVGIVNGDRITLRIKD